MSSPTMKAPHPLLAKYLTALAQHPLRTKAITTGTFSFLQEILGSHFAGVPPTKLPHDASFLAVLLSRAHVSTRALKMAIYGFCVSAPLAHFLVGTSHKLFAGKTGLKARIAQILVHNLVVSPIQISAYLTSMAIINGASSVSEITKTVKTGFLSVIRTAWTISPFSMFIAQQYLPVELWVPYFNVIQFVLGTYFNTRVKQLRLAAARKAEREKKDAEKKD